MQRLPKKRGKKLTNIYLNSMNFFSVKVLHLHAHLHSSVSWVTNCGDVDRLKEVAPILKISVDELVATALLRLL